MSQILGWIGAVIAAFPTCASGTIPTIDCLEGLRPRGESFYRRLLVPWVLRRPEPAHMRRSDLPPGSSCRRFQLDGGGDFLQLVQSLDANWRTLNHGHLHSHSLGVD